MLKMQICKHRRLRLGLNLRIYEFEFVTRSLNDLGTTFRTDAQPVDAVRRADRAVAFDTHFETGIVQRTDRGRVE